MILPEQCFREDVLATVVSANELKEVQIEKLDDGDFYLTVTTHSGNKPFYLSTQRNPTEPRRFKKIDPIVTTAYKLFGEECRIVIIKKSNTVN
jgi:hypothetical protein